MRKKNLILFAVVWFVGLAHLPVHAQQFDAAFGFGGVTSPGPSTDSLGNIFPSIRGGLYPSFSADLLIKHHFGVQGEASWRARRNAYGGFQPYRPIFYDFNAIWAPPLGNKATAELMAGVGGEDLRFYGYVNCSSFSGCTNYVSSNHLDGHFGAGLRFYVWHNLFVRPEAHLYVVRNNGEFSSGQVARFAVSIGYSFKPGF